MNPVVEVALGECAASVLGSIQTNSCHPSVVHRFVAQFRPPFVKAITGKETEEEPRDPAEYVAHTLQWLNDRGRITALARAIGALADHIAGMIDVRSAAPQEVTHDHLMEAFRILSPQCDVNRLILKQYCTGVAEQGKASNNRRA